MRYGVARPSVRPPLLENLLAFRQRDIWRAKYGGLWGTPESWQPSPAELLGRAPRAQSIEGGDKPGEPAAPSHTQTQKPGTSRGGPSHCTNGVTGTQREQGCGWEVTQEEREGHSAG